LSLLLFSGLSLTEKTESGEQYGAENLTAVGDGQQVAEVEVEEGAAQRRIIDAVSKAGKRLQEEAEHRFTEEGMDARLLREVAARAASGEEDDDASEGSCLPL
jgi:hypothetical protein